MPGFFEKICIQKAERPAIPFELPAPIFAVWHISCTSSMERAEDCLGSCVLILISPWRTTMLAVKTDETYPVLGIDISTYSKDDFFTLIEERLKDEDEAAPPLFVVTVNPEIAIQSIVDKEFKEVLKRSSIKTADGVGISWAIKFLFDKEIDRITGSDSIEKICDCCDKHDQSVFFYGAAPGIAEKAAQILKDRTENLKVSGTYSPERKDVPFDELPLQTRLSLKKSSVVLVALGAPAQEKWIYANLDKLTNCKLIIGIGGSFDFIAGSAKRAPEFFRKSGLEWMYRLYREPSRWRRMMMLPLFALNILFLKSSSRSVRESNKFESSKFKISENGTL
jgi:N-acetylglucosaminyldiphosphoundecaprenol N-acetyl-beta-D-mannosaminyltransferase